ncbi:YfcE family phosphodiesterase [candidate division KSB1 bacterium]|nr:YfcE family phosphodiesterase [candidate division KSB1 bacterium]
MPTITVISDSHKLIRSEVCQPIQNADYVIHAGDIGSTKTYVDFQNLNANIIFVRGNMDRIQELPDIPETNAFSISGHDFYILHEIDKLDINPQGNFDIVIFGHSHKPGKYTKNGVLYLNPGSIGPRRFTLPISFAKIIIDKENQFTVKFFNILNPSLHGDTLIN